MSCLDKKTQKEQKAEKISLFSFDKSYCAENDITKLCGTDEAGRGPLAGDVFAAAVILPVGLEIAGLNDSKKLSEKKREQLFEEITEKAVAFAIASASVEEIERLNILAAAMLAMKRAVNALDTAPDFVFVDGNKLPDLDFPSKAIIGGDGKSAAVAAASILAKVSRDRFMKEAALKYPEYEFERHKGYGTKLHYEKIREYGVCPIHRPSFLKKIH